MFDFGTDYINFLSHLTCLISKERKIKHLFWMWEKLLTSYQLLCVRNCARWKKRLKSSSSSAAAAKSLQECLTLCDPIDGNPPGSPIPGILQARTLEWVAIRFSHAWKWKVKVKSFSRVRLFATPCTAAYQAPRPWDFPGKSTGVGCRCLFLKDE